MKRSLRESRKAQENCKSNTLNNEQKEKLEKIKNMAKQYEGKNENEIFNELSKHIANGKKDGSINQDTINGLAETVAPLLNGEQRARLDELMKKLK